MFSQVVSYLIPAILIFALYYSFKLEISHYFRLLFLESGIPVSDLKNDYFVTYQRSAFSVFETLWVINYSIIFLSILSFVNFRKIRSRELGFINLGLNIILLVIFLAIGLYDISNLRESFLHQSLPVCYQNSFSVFGIRYISFAFVGLLLTTIYYYLQQEFMGNVLMNVKADFDLLFYSAILWIASSELIHWMDVLQFLQSYKLGLSILWGIYALLLIVMGIWKKKKHLRFGAIALFAVTLVKLFLYDISYLDTIAKTIVFVALGVLLLIISFLYHKYKFLISGDEDPQNPGEIN
jgi:hypothetical protein